mgnify:CR=1 FL=1
MFRLLLLGFVIYFLSRVIAGLFKPAPPSVEIKGQSKNDALDLSRADVQDVEFKEIKK